MIPNITTNPMFYNNSPQNNSLPSQNLYEGSINHFSDHQENNNLKKKLIKNKKVLILNFVSKQKKKLINGLKNDAFPVPSPSPQKNFTKACNSLEGNSTDISNNSSPNLENWPGVKHFGAWPGYKYPSFNDKWSMDLNNPNLNSNGAAIEPWLNSDGHVNINLNNSNKNNTNNGFYFYNESSSSRMDEE